MNFNYGISRYFFFFFLSFRAQNMFKYFENVNVSKVKRFKFLNKEKKFTILK